MGDKYSEVERIRQRFTIRSKSGRGGTDNEHLDLRPQTRLAPIKQQYTT